MYAEGHGSPIESPSSTDPALGEKDSETENPRPPLSYKTLERFLEEGRRLKLVEDDVTPDKILIEYDKQRCWFRWIFCLASILGFIVLILVVLSTFFDFSGGRRGSPVVNSRESALHTHYTCMTLSIIVGIPLGVTIYRLFPEASLYTLKYVHTGIFSILICLFSIGLIDMILHHEHFAEHHFETLHSWIGLLLTLILCLEFCSGLVFYIGPENKGVTDSQAYRNLNLRFHKVLGELIFPMGVASWATGMSSISYQMYGRSTLRNSAFWNVIGIISLAFTLLLFILIFNPRFRRRSRPVLHYIYSNPRNSLLAHDASSATIVSKNELFSGVRNKILKMVPKPEEAGAKH